MQTSLHIYALTVELKDFLTGAKFIATEFYKKEREAYMLFKAEAGYFALGLAYHPVGFGGFFIPRSKIKIDTKEKPWPFFQEAVDSTVVSVSQYGLDRIFRLDLIKGGDKYAIVVEAIGPNGNIWLLDKDDKILATLRHKKYDANAVYTPPEPVDRLNPFDCTPKSLKEVVGRVPIPTKSGEKPDNKPSASSDGVAHPPKVLNINEGSGWESNLRYFIKKNILGLNDILVDEIIHAGGLDDDLPVNDLTDSHFTAICTAVHDIAARFDNYGSGYIYNLRPYAAYPFKLKSVNAEAAKAKSLSLAVYQCIRDNKEFKAEVDQHQVIMDAVARFIKKLERKVVQIGKDVDNADNYEQYRKIAELLKINLASLKKGMKKVELEDIYSPDRGTVPIELDPASTPAENADRYFKKYRKGKDGLDLLQRRIEIARRELDAAGEMQAELERDFEGASKKYDAEIRQLIPAAAQKRETAPRLPYREYTLSSGVRIFVGKDGDDNDRTTFDHAKPYELWFHASQCPGSHVVMKFPDKNFEPSKAEIVETAAIAAYYSKARNSKTVPVAYTERKYVRKPRKAKPGLVTLEREKTVMVEPSKPE
jgi:predicted ribosome quality control (RQC) complex YloA/Tae2 family protein